MNSCRFVISELSGMLSSVHVNDQGDPKLQKSFVTTWGDFMTPTECVRAGYFIVEWVLTVWPGTLTRRVMVLMASNCVWICLPESDVYTQCTCRKDEAKKHLFHVMSSYLHAGMTLQFLFPRGKRYLIDFSAGCTSAA